MIKANIAPLNAKLGQLIRACKETRRFIKKYSGAEVITDLDTTQETTVLADLTATATLIETKFNEAKAIFVATDPVPEEEL